MHDRAQHKTPHATVTIMLKLLGSYKVLLLPAYPLSCHGYCEKLISTLWPYDVAELQHYTDLTKSFYCMNSRNLSFYPKANNSEQLHIMTEKLKYSKIYETNEC
jgi:hypothetical protein